MNWSNSYKIWDSHAKLSKEKPGLLYRNSSKRVEKTSTIYARHSENQQINDGCDFDIAWRAFSNRIDFSRTLYTKVQGAGSTPEEAVATLWIALNKK